MPWFANLINQHFIHNKTLNTYEMVGAIHFTISWKILADVKSDSSNTSEKGWDGDNKRLEK